jgi:RNA polymerase sigma factor (sigma-70 family)
VADVLQLTWLSCVEHLNDLREPRYLGAWLVTTCRRECLRAIRQQRRCIPQDVVTAESSIAAVSDPAGDPFDEVARRDDAALLYAALDELPDRQRRVVMELMNRDDGGYVAASERLGLPLGSLGPTRRRALDRLRRDRRLQVIS